MPIDIDPAPLFRIGDYVVTTVDAAGHRSPPWS